MSGLIIHHVDEAGIRTEMDLRNLTIGDRKCADMLQHELFRALKHLVPGIDATMGRQELMSRMCSWMKDAAAKPGIDRDAAREEMQREFDALTAQIARI